MLSLGLKFRFRYSDLIGSAMRSAIHGQKLSFAKVSNLKTAMTPLRVCAQQSSNSSSNPHSFYSLHPIFSEAPAIPPIVLHLNMHHICLLTFRPLFTPSSFQLLTSVSLVWLPLQPLHLPLLPLMPSSLA
jgi:hypothetical protein